MSTTILSYFETPHLYQDTATVVDIQKNEAGEDVIILDKTIFYPQGGGQPYDLGTISNERGTFLISSVRYKEGVVLHAGAFSSGNLQVGNTVTCKVDEARRVLNSRLHSGGHIISCALECLGYFWEPHKGHHHPDGPYDEFKGSIEETAIEPLKRALEEKITAIQVTKSPVSYKILPLEELKKICRFVPSFIPKDKPSRAAIYHLPAEFGGDMAIPCGGTHVEHLDQIGPVTVPKIKCKDGIIKISYRL